MKEGCIQEKKREVFFSFLKKASPTQNGRYLSCNMTFKIVKDLRFKLF